MDVPECHIALVCRQLVLDLFGSFCAICFFVLVKATASHLVRVAVLNAATCVSAPLVDEVVRGELFSWQRLKAIYELNMSARKSGCCFQFRPACSAV